MASLKSTALNLILPTGADQRFKYASASCRCVARGKMTAMLDLRTDDSNLYIEVCALTCQIGSPMAITIPTEPVVARPLNPVLW